MEDVLELYAEPYDPKRPKVNFDETSKQLLKETRQPLGAAPGKPHRVDYEYERNGTRNLFLFVEPQAGWRHVHVTEQRTKLDFAYEMKWLVDERYAEAEVIRVVMDNLNTHKIASLYEAFEPAEARRIAKKLEWHYTPLDEFDFPHGPQLLRAVRAVHCAGFNKHGGAHIMAALDVGDQLVQQIPLIGEALRAKIPEVVMGIADGQLRL